MKEQTNLQVISKIFLLIIFLPLIAMTQQKREGIKWLEDLEWNDVKAKAKKENKYIFIDCFATWCRPCKWMEKNTYSSEKVIQFVNKNFVCLKIQMNKTNADSDYVKRWYNEAENMANQYRINAYPSFLFFSPNGEIVHKAVGAYSEINFLNVLLDGISNDKQYYTMLRKYLEGIKDTSVMKQLAKASAAFGDTGLAHGIANDYLGIVGMKAVANKDDMEFMTLFKRCVNVQKIANEYLISLEGKNIYTKENIKFMATFIQDSKDKKFNIFLNNADTIDQVMETKDFAYSVIQKVIKNEEILPYWRQMVESGDKSIINWTKIEDILTEKYGKNISKRCVLEAKVKVFEYYTEKFNKSWAEYCKYNVRLINEYGTDTSNGMADAVLLNNFAYNVILFHSTNKKQITSAIKWMEGVIRRHPDQIVYMDTYANLLYKIGRTREALLWEERAFHLAIQRNEKEIANQYKKVIEKIKNGESTWFVRE